MKKLLLSILFTVLVCGNVFASFPTTGVLDSFNRANEGPPITGWTDLFSSNKIVSTQAVGTTGGGGNLSYLAGGSYTDSEVYTTIATKAIVTGDSVFVFLRSNFSSGNAYAVEYVENTTGTDTILLLRFDGFSATTLATYNQEVTAGDSIGGLLVGSTLTAEYESGAGGFTALGSVTDSTYSAAGQVGFDNDFTTTSPGITNFGGGTYTPSVSETDYKLAKYKVVTY